MSVRSLAVLLSFCMGLLSLSQEIAWVRLVSFGHQGRPHAFAIVLVAFLLGIAAGALWGSRRCRADRPLLPLVGRILGVVAVLDLAALWIAPWLMAQSLAAMLALMFVIGGCAAVKGTLFPIIHHLGSQSQVDGIGRSVSRVYVANVLGSALGPVLTGFVLLDVLTVDQIISLVSLGAVGLSSLLWWQGRANAAARAWKFPAVAALLGAASLVWPARSLETMAEMGGDTLRHMVQNKHGVVHVAAGDDGGDITFGGNVYDGRLNLDMRSNSNRLDRAYLLAALHPRPARVLVIGLSTGAWTQALLGMPGVEQVDVVEINLAYLDLVRRYPEVAPLLADPRVHVHIDDGRRWLARHASKKFDLIVMNTTFHWRAYISMLLSAEFMARVRDQLAPDGIFAFNTTNSVDAYLTATEVFADVGRHFNFAYASQTPLRKLPNAEERLRACQLRGAAAFPDGLFAQGAIGDELAHAPLARALDTVKRQQSEGSVMPERITDLNLVTEFRHGRPPLGGILQPWLPPTPLAP